MNRTNVILSTKIFFVLILIFIFQTSTILHAGDSPGEISGKAYFEYYLPADTDKDFERFQFNRIYFGYDKQLSEDFAVRYRLDGNRGSQLTDTSGTKDYKWRPFLKHAFISWANLIPDAKLYIGMQGTPNWGYSEGFWGYRAVEKTIQDLHHIGTSADLGFGLKGKVAGDFVYHLIYANGSGYGKPEKNNYKKVYSQLAYTPENGLIGSVLFDYEPQDADNANTTITVFGGYEAKQYKAGFEYVTFTKKGDHDVVEAGFSVFGKVNVPGGGVFARFDSFDPDDGHSDDENTYIILGFDYKADKKFHVMPNIRTSTTGSEDAENSFHLNFEYKF